MKIFLYIKNIFHLQATLLLLKDLSIITDFTLVSGETQKKLKGSYLFSTDWKDSVVFDIETGNYDKLIFSIGVDSVANKGLDQSNDLDPSNDMSWDWNTGYKFLLLEGRYSTLSKKGGIVYHIGENKNYKTLQFNLVESVKIINEQQSAIIIKTDILGLFKPNEVDLDVLNNAQFGANVTIIADNYSKSMFSISQIINP